MVLFIVTDFDVAFRNFSRADFILKKMFCFSVSEFGF